MSAHVLRGTGIGPKPPKDMNCNQREAQSAQPALQMPNANNLREVTILSKSDWDRIQEQLNRRAVEQDQICKAREERERLHKLSKEKVQNWANTVAGQRQRKLEARQIREAKEEEERKQADLEEAKYQAHKRKEAIEKAKTQQYYQTDRVKGFHGALVLTEVLKEREAQVELKHLKESASQGKDKDWLKQARAEHEIAILKDQEEAAQRIAAARETASFQKAQIKEHLKQHQKQKDDEDIESQELRRLAAQTELEKRKLGEIRAAEARQMLADNLKQIEDVKKMREINLRQEEDEDDECRVFAAAKRKMMKLRAEKEKQLHDEKQEGLEKIREKLHAQMQQIKDDEDDRIKRALEVSEEKRAKEEAAKEQYNRKMYAEIAEHRYQQMSDKEKQVAEKRKKELEMLLVKKEADALFSRNEEEKRVRKKMDMKALQDFHSAQMNERRMLSDREIAIQLAVDKKNAELVADEEKQFQEYARKVIDHCEKGGRNTYPLYKAAREGAGGGLGPQFPGKGGIRPSYMVNDQSGVQLPHYQRDGTNEVKKDIYGKEQTGKRLGFVW